MKYPLVTIGVALYNNRNYLARCLHSIVEQKYENIEILIIDDGSTDNPENIIAEFLSDLRIHYIRQENGGLSSGRQHALNVASGDYMCFIDADDYLEKNYVSDFVNRLEYANADIAICGTRFVDSNDVELEALANGYSYHNEADMISITKEMLVNQYSHLLEIYFMSDSWNKMYRTEFLKNSGVGFELKKGFNGSDLAFNHKVLLHLPKVVMLKQRNYVHVIYANSAVHRRKKGLHDGLEIIFEQLISETQKLGMRDEIEAELGAVYIGFLRYIIQDAKKENESIKDFYKELSMIKNRSEVFCAKNNLSVFAANTHTKSMKWFKILYCKKNMIGLLVYLNTRDWLLRKTGKTH